ncbi:hypothetical protein ACWGII_18700 [Streptomyces sp. NPDC054855]
MKAMSESFATTVAAVAPVIMLVASVELSANKERIRAAYLRGEQITNARAALSINGARPTRQEFDDARRALRVLQAGRRARALVHCYALSAFVAFGALAVAEGMALNWLAHEERGPARLEADACYWSMGSAFFWVLFVTGARLLYWMRDGDPRSPRFGWPNFRYWILCWKYRGDPDDEDTRQAPTE